ncbi:hypothetical protein C8J56DRAFT_1004410 [Mycena floridula]|nr:hypothetical protein C8J56DRAFT_1004410 [Mycena floridula]
MVEIVSHSGTSQYATGGISSCGLAALNCVRVILSKERAGLKGEALVQDILTRKTMEEIMSISFQWPNAAHLEVETIFKVPIFESTLSEKGSTYGSPDLASFKKLLLELAKSSDSSSAVVITRPPEIICCMRIPTPRQSVYVIFDSHPRSRYPDGAAFIVSKSLDTTASEITNLLAIDSSLLADVRLGWEAQLMSQFSGLFFISRHSNNTQADLSQAVLECSLETLSLRAQVSTLQSQNQLLQSTNERLEDEVEKLHERCARHNQTLELQICSQCKHGVRQRNHETKPVAGPSRSRSSQDKGKTSSHRHSKSFSTDYDMQMRLQLQFAEEDSRLLAERKALEGQVQVVFDCGICLESLPEDYRAMMDPCRHSFCRDCIRQHIVTKIGEHRFPVFCPSCTSGDATQSAISGDFIQMVGIPDKNFAVFEEMQLTAFSILLHCRKCQNSVFVDRGEYEEARILTCPLPKCNHVWCKACQQAVDVPGPQHSCDGSSELQDLMEKRGWKHCPGCKTPIQKYEGCNHMTCMAPGCNTHFCYSCGASIVRSAVRREIQTAIQNHYRQCQLIEIPRNLR